LLIRLILCGIYYAAWIYVLPYFGKYKIRQEALLLDDGAVSHVLRKIPLNELEGWDLSHDAIGHKIEREKVR
jgi:hypothetical protein